MSQSTKNTFVVDQAVDKYLNAEIDKLTAIAEIAKEAHSELSAEQSFEAGLEKRINEIRKDTRRINVNLIINGAIAIASLFAGAYGFLFKGAGLIGIAVAFFGLLHLCFTFFWKRID